MPNSMIPKVYVNAPYYVDKEEKFYINVEVRADDVNRIDTVEVNGYEATEDFSRELVALDTLNLKFGPFSIKEDKVFEIKVIFDDNNTINKKIEVNVKED